MNAPTDKPVTERTSVGADLLNNCYAKDPSIVCRNVDTEVILVPIRKNIGDLETIFTLNETGARIWELIDGRKSVAQVKQSLVDEFEVTPQEAETDIADFIAQLESIGAIALASK